MPQPVREEPTYVASNYGAGMGVGAFITPSAQPQPQHLFRCYPQNRRVPPINVNDIVHEWDKAFDQSPAPFIPPQNQGVQTVGRRLVQVFIIDPDERMPLDESILHQSNDPFLTDLTDQEIFYGLHIAEMLSGHNERRAETLDKKATNQNHHGENVYLEPIRVRDLRMVVVTMANF
jgi:hypothetical protein